MSMNIFGLMLELAPLMIDRSVTSVRSLLQCAQPAELMPTYEEPNIPELDVLDGYPQKVRR